MVTENNTSQYDYFINGGVQVLIHLTKLYQMTIAINTKKINNNMFHSNCISI